MLKNIDKIILELYKIYRDTPNLTNKNHDKTKLIKQPMQILYIRFKIFHPGTIYVKNYLLFYHPANILPLTYHLIYSWILQE